MPYLLRASPRKSFHEQPNWLWLCVPAGCYQSCHCHFLFWICDAVIMALSHTLDMGCQCTRPGVNCFAVHLRTARYRCHGISRPARSCKAVASAGAAGAARRQTAEREAGVLDGDRRPFRRAVFTGGWGGVIAQAPVVQSVLSMCDHCPLREQSARVSGCGEAAGRGAAKGPVFPFLPARRCAPKTQLPHASVCPHILSTNSLSTKYEERRPRELKCTALLAPPTA
jgi:hypothetical protein